MPRPPAGPGRPTPPPGNRRHHGPVTCGCATAAGPQHRARPAAATRRTGRRRGAWCGRPRTQRHGFVDERHGVDDPSVRRPSRRSAAPARRWRRRSGHPRRRSRRLDAVAGVRGLRGGWCRCCLVDVRQLWRRACWSGSSVPGARSVTLGQRALRDTPASTRVGSPSSVTRRRSEAVCESRSRSKASASTPGCTARRVGRLVERQAGEVVFVEGERRAMTSNIRRAQIRHVVGRFEVCAGGGLARRITVVPNLIACSHRPSSLCRIHDGCRRRGAVHRVGDRRRRPPAAGDGHGVPCRRDCRT